MRARAGPAVCATRVFTVPNRGAFKKMINRSFDTLREWLRCENISMMELGALI